MHPIQLYAWTLRDQPESLFLSPQSEAGPDEHLVLKQNSGNNVGQVLSRKASGFERVSSTRPYWEHNPHGFQNGDPVWILEPSILVNGSTHKVSVFNLRTHAKREVRMETVSWNFSHKKKDGTGKCLLLSTKSTTNGKRSVRCITVGLPLSGPWTDSAQDRYSYTGLEEDYFNNEYSQIPLEERCRTQQKLQRQSKDHPSLTLLRREAMKILSKNPVGMLGRIRRGDLKTPLRRGMPNNQAAAAEPVPPVQTQSYEAPVQEANVDLQGLPMMAWEAPPSSAGMHVAEQQCAAPGGWINPTLQSDGGGFYIQHQGIPVEEVLYGAPYEWVNPALQGDGGDSDSQSPETFAQVASYTVSTGYAEVEGSAWVDGNMNAEAWVIPQPPNPHALVHPGPYQAMYPYDHGTHYDGQQRWT